MKVAVLGTGSWGTALAQHLSRAGKEVVLWGHDAAVIKEINTEHTNRKYFPDDSLLTDLVATTDMGDAVSDVGMIVVSVPSFAVRETAKLLATYKIGSAYVVNSAKGMEDGSLLLMSDVLSQELGVVETVGALSGPSFALEVLRGLPTAVTVAGKSMSIAKDIANLFHYDYFRVYSSSDLVGVQLGGVVKNVISLAVGMVDGVGAGLNARAALITRGVAEMQRLVLRMGGDRLTVVGLSGLGDLLLTATGDLSRNRRVGVRLGQGAKLQDILIEIGQVAEGVQTCHKIIQLSRNHDVHMPIVEEVNRVLEGECSVKDSVKTLLSRSQKPEASSAT